MSFDNFDHVNVSRAEARKYLVCANAPTCGKISGRITLLPFPFTEKEWTRRVAGILVISGAENISATRSPPPSAPYLPADKTLSRSRWRSPCSVLDFVLAYKTHTHTHRTREKPCFTFTSATPRHLDRAQFGKKVPRTLFQLEQIETIPL